MKKSIADEILEGLKDFADRLKRGEFIFSPEGKLVPVPVPVKKPDDKTDI